VTKALQVLWFPAAVIAVTALLGRRWPTALRRASRCLAGVVGAALLGIVVSGLAHGSRPAAAIHRWLPHGLLILARSAIPLAIGVTLAGSRRRPFVRAGRSLGLVLLLGALWVASLTGYLGPSQGPIDAVSLARFRMLHYGLCPSVSFALVIWWYHGLEVDGGPRSRDRSDLPAEG
jgi:hypothetical protein